MQVKEIKHGFIPHGFLMGHNAVLVKLGGRKTKNLFEVLDEIKQYNTSIIYFRGTEPLRQQNQLLELLLYLDKYYVIIKTGGNKIPPIDMITRVSYWYISPQIHVEKPVQDKYNYDAIDVFKKKTAHCYVFYGIKEKHFQEMLILRDQWKLTNNEIYVRFSNDKAKKFALENGLNLCLL